ncbi:FAD-dependent oxidoreductase [Alicycliphilus denitrificans]|uniref:Oxidoreductase FAD/NAD(P)-binding domain protein n=2 Tax=Alicycliphilus denitrificans TaxID=179636 RepID=F4G6Y2_ALIDK|nr:FAD-dependent oxidoreductase [Alicycliphilus denitrificans]AEB83148.1 oxidoreductase FAD/NAD(P)-binding domain protein [Alicycliphilus denitrificans K601]QKD42919.1 FAD-dependent oxidoreductase [Alicycliphilus denitrificans]GAO26573.1 oxidoreductase FAD/NAD(P)-binding domain-containing protein [Alicycliphilus sp. B1]
MATYTVKLQARQPVAEGTMAFHLEKPAGFEFRPGQAMEVILPGGAEGEEGRHAFSIVSAPHEAELVFATRMRDSAFKRALAALPLGASLDIDGPFGSLILHKKAERAGVLVAGGIGITPFMSMLRNAAEQHSEQSLVLLYSNRRPEDAAFLAELQALAQRHPKFRLVATMTGMARSQQAWDGATGYIDGAFVRRAIEGLPAPIFYVSGPPALVEAMRGTLVDDAGVDEDDVRSEEFYGY